MSYFGVLHHALASLACEMAPVAGLRWSVSVDRTGLPARRPLEKSMSAVQQWVTKICHVTGTYIRRPDAQSIS